MAQTGYTPISLYYSSTASATPTAGNLVPGELAINTADGKLFYKDSAGVVQVIAGKSGAGIAAGSNTQVQYNSSGNLAGSANFTFNGTTVTIANDASISGLTVGKGGGAISTNTAFGVSAGVSNTTGADNTFVGQLAGQNNTDGIRNSALGSQALQNNLSGQNTVAIGYLAAQNTTANGNTAVGSQALQTNTTGTVNIAIGRSALLANTTGAQNAATGALALTANTTGSFNVANGYQALQANTTASNNTAVGYQAGYSNSTGTQNTFIGRQSGYLTTSNYNTFVGDTSGYNTTGTYNTFLGTLSGQLITTGAKNTIIGAFGGNTGGLDIRTASNYIVLSDGDGNPRVVVNGSGNTFVGGVVATWDERFGVSTSSNIVVSGLYDSNASYTSSVLRLQTETGGGTTWQLINGRRNGGVDVFVVYGNGSVTNSTGSYGTISDAKLKENIVDATSKLNDVMQLKVRNFNFKDEPNQKQIGFVAQELETVFPSLVESVEDKDEDDNLLGTITKQVKTTVLIPILVKAIQELKAEVDSLKQQLAGK